MEINTNEYQVWTEESLTRSDFKEGVASYVEKRPPSFTPLKVD